MTINRIPLRLRARWRWQLTMARIDDWAFTHTWIPDPAYRLVERLTVGRGEKR